MSTMAAIALNKNLGFPSYFTNDSVEYLRNITNMTDH